MTQSDVRLARDDRGVVACTLDGPATRNALGAQVLAEIDHILQALAGDPSVRVIVLSGAGEVFSSGADRTEITDPRAVENATARVSSILTLIDESAVPVVCRVNGPAFGAGLAIVAAADISIAVSDAVFGLPEVRFGMVAGPAAAACLGRIGQAAALDLLLTGRRFTAGDAERMHLVSAVVAREELDAAVERCVADLLLGDASALAATRRLVRRSTGPALGELLRAAGISSAAAR